MTSVWKRVLARGSPAHFVRLASPKLAGSMLAGLLLAGAALACLVPGGQALAATTATGYDSDYDFAGHGADWYGRSSGTEIKYDYAAPSIDRFLSGDDFGAGYERGFDALGLGPVLEHTQAHHTEYSFRFNPGAVAPPAVTACGDGIDNDGDGLVDYPADPGCLSAADAGERDLNGPACDDTRDNDGDGLFDYPDDPGCSAPADADERDPLAPACDDGIDNDDDGLADYPADPGCESAFDDSEAEGIPDLRVEGKSLLWSDVPSAVGYDVVYGDAGKLTASGGDFSAGLIGCLADDQAVLTLPATGSPEAGGALWYLVRAVFNGLVGTWDSGGAAQAAPRDRSIASSPAACP